MSSIQDALQQATESFTTSDSAALDAQLLLAHVLGKDRTYLYTWPERKLTREQQRNFLALCARRAKGEPVAYLLGKRGFWKAELEVNPAVLIPRPETELLVELALQLGANLEGKVADLGTGSGAIAIALAGERADWQVYATELSAEAQSVAATNFRNSALPNLHLLAGSWCNPLPAHDFVLIASNPPYIDENDPHLEQGDIRFEPRSALVAPDTGMADLCRIAEQSRDYLVEGGWLLLEHGWQQGSAVRRLLEGLGYTEVRTHFDHGNRERVTVGCNGQA
jgi:release factor glutamine methyltransferase